MVVLLVALTALGGCGGGDDGGDDEGRPATDEFYGVVTGEPLPEEPEVARLGRGGVGTLRINLPWGSVQSAPDASYDWSRYDALIGAAAENRIRVFATIYSSPVWAAATPEHPPLDRLDEFEAFARAAVERYGSDGAFWSENPALPRVPITHWEVWNEPNRLEFWPAGPDPDEYLELLRAASTAIKGADPKAHVVLAGLFFEPSPEDGIPLAEYVPELYEAGGGDLFDAVAVHPYAKTPKDALQSVKGTREVMERFGDGEKPIWLTEIGWATAGIPSGVTVGPEEQAEYLTETFELMAENRDSLGIAGVIWYSLADIPGGDIWVYHSGLFTLDGTPKPSWDAFVELTGGTPR
ncbi:MAG: GH39 family glycosyl hydrolase [Solirubrobacterales bacterium]